MANLFDDLAQRLAVTSTPPETKPEQAGLGVGIAGAFRKEQEPYQKLGITGRLLGTKAQEAEVESRIGEKIGKEYAPTEYRLSLLRSLGNESEQKLAEDYLRMRKSPLARQSTEFKDVRAKLQNPEYSRSKSELEKEYYASLQISGRAGAKGLSPLEAQKVWEDLMEKYDKIVNHKIMTDELTRVANDVYARTSNISQIAGKKPDPAKNEQMINVLGDVYANTTAYTKDALGRERDVFDINMAKKWDNLFATVVGEYEKPESLTELVAISNNHLSTIARKRDQILRVLAKTAPSSPKETDKIKRASDYLIKNKDKLILAGQEDFIGEPKTYDDIRSAIQKLFSKHTADVNALTNLESYGRYATIAHYNIPGTISNSRIEEIVNYIKANNPPNVAQVKLRNISYGLREMNLNHFSEAFSDSIKNNDLEKELNSALGDIKSKIYRTDQKSKFLFELLFNKLELPNFNSWWKSYK